MATKAKSKSMSKIDMVRDALDCGQESPKEIVKYIKDIYGVKISDAHVSVCKSEIKRKNKPMKSRGVPFKKAMGMVSKAEKQTKSTPSSWTWEIDIPKSTWLKETPKIATANLDNTKSITLTATPYIPGHSISGIIQSAKKLLSECGSVEEAKNLIDAMER